MIIYDNICDDICDDYSQIAVIKISLVLQIR